VAAGYRSREEAERAAVEHDWGIENWLAGKDMGNCDALTLGRMTVSPGRSDLPHSHGNSVEVLYLIKGTVAQIVGEETIMMEAGDTVVIPAGTPHMTHNHGDADADIIVAYPSGTREFNVDL
jgi:mannose-6-phosphate isomerase-like protein (cupin superfamily)